MIKFLTGIMICILAACGFFSIKKTTEPEAEKSEAMIKPSTHVPIEQPKNEPSEALENLNEVLDKRVVADAKRRGQDESSHRLLVREDPDGGKVFRQVGMFVIINPNGEEAYLPDEI